MSDNIARAEQIMEERYGPDWSIHPHEGPCTMLCEERVAECLQLLLDLREIDAL